MKLAYITDKNFSNRDFTTEPPEKGEYENCEFNGCNFSEADLSAFIFSDCVFNGCNLSLVKLEKTAFRDCKFSECKMLGVNFESCNPFGLSFVFENCNLGNASFFGLKIKGTRFKNSNLEEVDFTGCDLSAAVFGNCSLKGAIFDNTNLEKADFRTASHYSINPENNKIKKAKFAMPWVLGLLNKYNIEIEN